jgi:hypothetical protein
VNGLLVGKDQDHQQTDDPQNDWKRQVQRAHTGRQQHHH